MHDLSIERQNLANFEQALDGERLAGFVTADGRIVTLECAADGMSEITIFRHSSTDRFRLGADGKLDLNVPYFLDEELNPARVLAELKMASAIPRSKTIELLGSLNASIETIVITNLLSQSMTMLYAAANVVVREMNPEEKADFLRLMNGILISQTDLELQGTVLNAAVFFTNLKPSPKLIITAAIEAEENLDLSEFTFSLIDQTSGAKYEGWTRVGGNTLILKNSPVLKLDTNYQLQLIPNN